MRIFDLNPARFCDACLKKQHRAVHQIEEYLRNDKNHGNADVRRWKGHEDMLNIRHELLAAEMLRRGMIHKSPLKVEVHGISPYPENTHTEKAELTLLLKCPDCADMHSEPTPKFTEIPVIIDEEKLRMFRKWLGDSGF